MAFSMLKIRRPLGRLIFNMGIAIPGKTVFLIETAPWSQWFCCHIWFIPVWEIRMIIKTWQSVYSAIAVKPWWLHQMETYSALLVICAGNSPVPSEFPAQRPVTRSFDVFFDLSLNKQLSKQWWGWWFKMLSHPLWRHCNDTGQVED